MKVRSMLILAAALTPAAAMASSWAFASPAKLKPNMTSVKVSFNVSNDETNNAIAKCPGGTRIFSGGFASDGLQAKVYAAGPSRSENGYLVYAVVPPISINAGVVKETAKITALAYCAPAGQPIVLGN